MLWRYVFRWIVLLLSVVLAAPASARAQDPVLQSCHAAAAADEDYQAVASRPERWTCAPQSFSFDADRTFIRFDLSANRSEQPDQFATRLTRFSAMRLTVMGVSGSLASKDLTEADMIPSSSEWEMRARLPQLDEPLKRVIVRIDRPRHVLMLADAALVRQAPADSAIGLFSLVVAGLCGLMVAPLIFNIAFYRVLRQRFLVWHFFAVIFMLAQTLVTSSLFNRFANLSIPTLAIVSALSFGLGIAAAALFLADLIEPKSLDRRLRNLLRAAPVWIMLWTCVYLFAGSPLRAVAPTLYFLSYVPVILLFAAVLFTAAHRGSRSVWFQIAAWFPLLLIGSARVFSSIGLTPLPLELEEAQHFAIAWDIIVTALSVADRFMMLRRQRDRAVSEVRQLGNAVERDPLTGLLNRHALEQRFAELYVQGFCTMAVIDLDRFKAVNDAHGHAKGDEVLCATAAALAADEDTQVIRMGGEEFLLLLRGDDAVDRAERRRKAIPGRVAAEVPGLERIVTASMGLVERAPSGPSPRDFHSVYKHCDRLLYEAKRLGRNLTMRERVTGFSRASQRTRGAA